MDSSPDSIPARSKSVTVTSDCRDLAVLAAGIFALIIVFHIASALAGYPFFRDQHLGAALDYAKNGVKWLHPIIPGFNANGLGTPLEIPIWQALASLPLKAFGGWWGWANVVSLIIFSLSIPPVWMIAKSALGERGAWWAVIAFLAQPLLILVAGQASADGLAFVLALWALYALLQMIQKQDWRWFLAACMLGGLSATTKLPLFFCVGVSCGLHVLFTDFRSLRKWLLLAGAGAVSALLFFVWSKMTDEVLFAAEFPYTKLWLKDNPAMWNWYFGDWSYRLNPFNYMKAGWAALNCLLGSFILVVALMTGFLTNARRLALPLLLGAVLTTLVFSHLVLVHRHYYVLYSLSIAILLGGSFSWLETQIRNGVPKWAAILLPWLMSAGILLSAIQGLIGIEVVLNFDPHPKEMAKIIQENVRPDEKILIQGGGWGGELLLRSERQGLSIWTDKAFKDPATLRRLKELGYSKLVMLSESPLLWALKKTNPGSAALDRESYRAEWSDRIDDWPNEVITEDIVIKTIP